jgi:3-isopropylmalate dehydrogenase
MKTYNVTLLPGDGIGPEVLNQAVKVMRAVEARFPVRFELHEHLVGAASIDQYGVPLTDETLASCMASQAILLGAVGHPKYSHAAVRPEQGLLQLRKLLGLYANIRPVKSWTQLLDQSPLKNHIADGADLVVVRELTGGLYYGESGRDHNGNSAFDTCIYYREEIERIAHRAFLLARERRKKLTLVDKANVLETSRFWRSIVTDISLEYSDVLFDCMYVDNAAMQIIRDPRQFDVLLTENMFGDILSDESSMIAASLGLLPSSSIGDQSALFEPVHGSWPEAAGKDLANPIAAILSVAMMLDYFQETKAATAVCQAVNWSLNQGFVTADINEIKPVSCSQLGNLLAEHILEENALQSNIVLLNQEQAIA